MKAAGKERWPTTAAVCVPQHRHIFCKVYEDSAATRDNRLLSWVLKQDDLDTVVKKMREKVCWITGEEDPVICIQDEVRQAARRTCGCGGRWKCPHDITQSFLSFRNPRTVPLPLDLSHCFAIVWLQR